MFRCQFFKKIIITSPYEKYFLTYQTSSFIIMKINCSSRVLSSLKRIHVLFRNPLSKVHVVATSSPKPATTSWNSILLHFLFFLMNKVGYIRLFLVYYFMDLSLMFLPSLPFLELSHPQPSKSPRLQFLVKVYITPAALIAWTNDVSLVATDREYKYVVLFFRLCKKKNCR